MRELGLWPARRDVEERVWGHGSVEHVWRVEGIVGRKFSVGKVTAAQAIDDVVRNDLGKIILK